MPEIAVWGWLLLALGAVIIGVSKTALPGAGTVAVAIFAAVLPARQSTGTILLLLILADLFAITAYRRHVNWKALARLAPAVIVGMVVGIWFLAVADDDVVGRVIGVLLIAVVAFTLGRRWLRRRVEESGPHPLAATGYGALGGFTTMVANAAGPVMSMYFLAARFPVKEFLGTAAWFFFLVNISKVPFSIGLGLITVPGLLVDLVLAPIVIAATFLGRWIANRLNQKAFERIVIALTLVGATYLILA